MGIAHKRKEEEYEEDEEDFSHAFGSGDGHGDEPDRVCIRCALDTAYAAEPYADCPR